MQKIQIFGQKPFKVRKPLKVEDLRAVAFFNRIIKNYHKMLRIEDAGKEPRIIGARPYEEVRETCHAVKGITDPDSQLLPSKEREHAVSPHGLSRQLQADQPK